MVPKTILRLVLLLCLFSSCGDRSKVFEEDTQPTVAIDSVQRDSASSVVIRLSKNGDVNSIIKGKLMVREIEHERPSKIKLYNGVIIEYMNPEHEVINTVNSQQGIYDEVAKYVILMDSVVVQNAEHETLYTEYLTWADSTHEFYTDQKVIINTRRQQITGIGLRAAEDFSSYTILQIKGVIQVEDNTF